MIDGRSTNGLKRAVARLLEDPLTVTEGQILGNYSRLVSMAALLSPKEIMAAEQNDLAKVLALLEEEEAVLPEPVRYSLVMRRAQGLLTAKQWDELMTCITPFGEKLPWNWRSPCLLSLCNQNQVIKTWQKMMFQDILSKLILEGESAAPQVRHLCGMSIKMLGAVDVVMLDNPSAKAHDEAMCCFRSLWALGAPGLEFDIEACCGEGGTSYYKH